MYKDTPFDLENDSLYQEWRERKLAQVPTIIDDLIVEINDPCNLSKSEHKKLLMQSLRSNMVIYASNIGRTAGTDILSQLGYSFGMHRFDCTLESKNNPVTELTTVKNRAYITYIPYTNRAIHWHTDGYYNQLDKQIYGLILHCVRPAINGGENGLMDHEIAYLLMRDTNPDYIFALMQPDVMMIPKNIINGVEVRPDRTGPVFMVTQEGDLHMRYTMRKKNIFWKKEVLVLKAITWLEALLKSESRYIFRIILQSGWGIISNNILHNRTTFKDTKNVNSKRLFYRGRYYDRISNILSE